MLINTLDKTVASCLVALLLCPLNVLAQSQKPSTLDAQGQTRLERLILVAPPPGNLLAMKAPDVNRITAPNNARQTPPAKCRRGRRSLIGALIGAGGTLPFVGLVHTRFENEAANGTAAAATAVVLGTAAGAFIGLATCGG